MKALLIVDLQEVLVPLVWRGPELVARLSALVTRARAAGVPVVGVRQVGPPGSFFDPAEPATRLALDVDVVLEKTATDAFYLTELAEVLQGVTAVVVAGVATDYCVDATVRSAVSHGLDVELVADGHAPVAGGDPAAGLTAEQIIARHNRLLSTAIHPGGTVTVTLAKKINFE